MGCGLTNVPRYPRGVRRYWVYILMNRGGTTLYIGVTGNLARRLEQHRSGVGSGFTSRYNVTRLVYVEEFAQVQDAIAREKQLKGWKRCRKEELIRSVNPRLKDLADEAVWLQGCS